jgi:hypothetical protein
MAVEEFLEVHEQVQMDPALRDLAERRLSEQAADARREPRSGIAPAPDTVGTSPGKRVPPEKLAPPVPVASPK